MGDVELQPAERFHWERTVRRCVLPGAVKLVAYTLAQYGDQRGENIRPGTPRLAAVCGVSTRVVERHVKVLRELGLLEKVRNGGGPRRLAAEYRLTTPADIFRRIQMLDKDETPGSQPAAVQPPRDTGSPATQVAAVRPTANSPSPAKTVAGDATPDEEELPPPGPELPPFRAGTPATDPPLTCDDAHHHPELHHPTTPPSRSPKSLPHLRDPPGQDAMADQPHPYADRIAALRASIRT